MAPFAGFIGGTGRGQSLLASPSRTVNWYLDRVKVEGVKKASSVYYPSPGLAPFAASVDAPGRGLFEHAGRAWAVLGARIVELRTDGSLMPRGTVAVDVYPATFTSNGEGGNQHFLTSGDQGYILDLATHVLTPVVPHATMGGYIDGFFIRFDINSSTIGVSAAFNGLVWDPTQIAQNELSADPWRAMAIIDDEIFLLGSKGGEVWFNKGTSPFPFGPRQSLIIEPGIAAPFSLKKINGRLTWLAQGENGFGQVVQASGYNVGKISTEELDTAIQGYSRIDDAVAYTYESRGHSFYTLNFPSAGATHVWDDTLKQWHERGQWNGGLDEYEAWSPQYHCLFDGHHLVADFRRGSIYRLADTLYTDVDNRPLRRMRIAHLPFNEHKRVYYDWLEVYFDPGQALPTGLGSNPKAMLRVSRDGAKTWGSERTRAIGTIGQYKHRCRWRGLGSGRDCAVKVSFSDPVPAMIVGASLGLRPGAA